MKKNCEVIIGVIVKYVCMIIIKSGALNTKLLWVHIFDN